MIESGASKYSRGEFLTLCVRHAAGFAAVCSMPKMAAAVVVKEPSGTAAASGVIDLRDFVRWIADEFEPSVRLAGGAGRYASHPGGAAPALYGVADMACILSTIGRLNPTEKERAEWAEVFASFQNAETGWFREKEPPTVLSPQHNTAFALAAMRLLDLDPRYALRMGAEYSDIRAYLNTLNWRTGVYTDSHKGAGVGSIYALVPALRSTAWFAEYFATCNGLLIRTTD